MLLIDASELDRVSRTIDPLQLPRRVNYEGVSAGAFTPRQLNPVYVSGKLAYKDTRFTAWVQERLTAAGTDAMCVDSADHLGGSQLRVTVNGQTRQGRSGAHGELKAPYVIGFSKEERLTEIADRIRELDQILGQIDKKLERHRQAMAALLGDKSAHEHMLAVEWRDIDPDGIRAEIKLLDARRETILKSDDSLRELRERLDSLEADIKKTGGAVYAAEDLLERLVDEQKKIVRRKDHVVDEIQRIEQAQTVTLADHQKTYLDSEFADVATPGDLRDFGPGVDRLKGRLAGNSKNALGKAEGLKRELEAAFQRYRDKWHDPNLSESVENYPSFRQILDSIISTGLHERRQEWAKRLTDWSGQDLVPLAGAFSHAIDDIRNRLAPVNAILASLPFGAHRHRLKIDLRELNRDDIVKFKRELKILSRANTDDFSDTQIQNWFTRLQKFMAIIRKDNTAKNTNRDYFLDVRKHIVITAVSYDSQGRERSTYAALGGKSGGETQELVAFIVGAALRFQLGDEVHERPRFAPVFLDEGFVKADSEFAGRAIDAWKGLGFQLIIGAPYGQFTALEPHADSVLYMAKNSKSHSSVKLLSPATPAAKASQDEESA
ncbi:SbcC/MukB-like Walker B domain-containing protein [Actinosynnema sp. CS-041913]|uniref:SbcC/MukB-like Walker B domain-containing protein n=1 Tax=Actinosynnema sp. CS-041913 TaxID=3239917 RepID=UPI003D8E9F11